MQLTNFPYMASLPYIISFILLTGVLFINNIKSKYNVLYFLVIILFMVLIGYKGEFSDWKAYREWTDACSCLGCTYFEPAYDLLTYIASQTLGFELIPIVSICIYITIIFKLSRYLSRNDYFIAVFSITVVYLPLYFGAIRQSIAFSLLLFAFLNFYDKKLIKGFIFALLASLFHYSSIMIIFLFLIFTGLYQMSKNIVIFIIVTVLGSAMLYVGLLYLFEYVGDYIYLISNDDLNAGENRGLKNILLPLERVIILIMSFYILTKDNSRYLKYMVLFAISGALFYLIMNSFSANTAGRIVAFFRLADCFVIYYFFKIILVRNERQISTKLNNLAILIVLMYSIIKYYFTILGVDFYR